MKLIDKLKKQVKENLKASTKSPKLLFKFTEGHYKKNMNDPQGFGVTDLKPSYQELYTALMKKYGAKVVTKLEDMSTKTVALYLKK